MFSILRVVYQSDVVDPLEVPKKSVGVKIKVEDRVRGADKTHILCFYSRN